MNKSTHPALPQEIYNTIIAHLRDDEQALNACSLVASTWRPTSQKLLHRAIVFHATLPPSPDGRSSTRSPVLGSEKTRLLLDTAFHILKHACSFVICGERESPYGCPKSKPERIPDPTLPAFLRHISTLALPSLSSVEIRQLRWMTATPDLQRALVLLLSGGSNAIKEVILADCDIPHGVQWQRFVGPETRLLKLHEFRLFHNPNKTTADYETSIEDLPVSSAPNLIHLDIGQVYSSRMTKWLLYSSETRSQFNTEAGVSHSPSFRGRVATLSLSYQYFTTPERLCDFIQAFTSLKTLKLHPPISGGSDINFPLNKIICIPTLNEISILPVTPRQISSLSSSFATILSYGLPSAYPRATKVKTIHIHMGVDLEPMAFRLRPVTFNELLDQLQALDAIVANMHNVEVIMKMTVWPFEPQDGPENIEKTKTTLEGWRANVNALKLEVS